MDVEELGPFLRRRREAVSPADVGLPPGGRRRTPGLRRAEVATLAGISVDYLVRLEQGRDRRPSADVLAALANVLQLDEDDRHYLRLFAALSTGRALCPNTPVPAAVVRPNVERVLDRLEPDPALVLNRLADVLAWNRAFERVGRPMGVLDGERPNVARFTFTDPRARSVFPDWDAVADDQVANLRDETWRDDPYAGDLLDQLAATGEAFSARWQADAVGRRSTGLQRWVHPDVGELRLTFETMRLADEGQRLVVLLPADDASAGALDHLAGRVPGGLRAVTRPAS